MDKRIPNTPIPVNRILFDEMYRKASGLFAWRRDENGQYWIKILVPKYVDYILNKFKL